MRVALTLNTSRPTPNAPTTAEFLHMEIRTPPSGSTMPSDGPSRRGLTSKTHLAVQQGQKPLSVVITAGQRGDSPQFEAVLEAIRIPRLGPSTPRNHPDRIRADKAYGSRSNRSYLHRRGIKAEGFRLTRGLTVNAIGH